MQDAGIRLDALSANNAILRTSPLVLIGHASSYRFSWLHRAAVLRMTDPLAAKMEEYAARLDLLAWLQGCWSWLCQPESFKILVA